ncbi:DUF421 domain-containing protein [Desulfitispora alkaliphila]|uniref:DUF421 domain-containing protein n=1 Tax=Desulfitispora alkaliphila TaxID=622674 RepID=UPI003D23A702
MLETLYRTTILYLTVLFFIRVMGKREVGKLSAFDLVVAIMIAELAAIPMEDTSIPLIMGLVPIFTIVILEIIFSFVSLKSKKVRAFVNGRPSIVIEKGLIIENEMRKLRLNINDLLSQLREKNISNIADVEYAILEISGKLSVIPKSNKRPVTPEDLNLNTEYPGLPLALIVDGQLDRENLENSSITEEWLQKELLRQGYDSYDSVLLASLDGTHNLYVSPKENP